MKKAVAFTLAFLLVLSLPASAFAAANTVTFYTDSSMTVVHDTQNVKDGGHPTVPAEPSGYTADGYQYKFNGWYWMMDGSAVEFSFTDYDCEIWLYDADIFAGYSQYLAEGYYLIVVYSGGTEFLEDTTTPVPTLLKNYPGITAAYTQSKQDYQSGTGSDKAATATVNGAEKDYETLAEAVSKADAGTVVKALADITLSDTLNVNKTLTLDFEGCSLSGAVTVGGTGALTLSGGDYTGMTLTVQSGGSVNVTGGTFGIDPSAYVDQTSYDVTESGGVYSVSPHTHSYDYSSPAWDWKVVGSSYKAVAAYSCACGSKTDETVKPSYTDNRGTRTYSAKDSHGNTSGSTVVLSYTVTLDGTPQETPYSWGDICTLTADTYKAWYVNGAKLSEGTETYSFAVTENTVVTTQNTSYTTPQAAVSAKIVSTASGTAAFNAKWSLPQGAKVTDVTIYRGYTTTDRTVDADTMIAHGAAFHADLLVRNGDYTLRLSGLTPTYYQHAVIVISYEIDGEAHMLTSAVQRVLPNGSDA